MTSWAFEIKKNKGGILLLHLPYKRQKTYQKKHPEKIKLQQHKGFIEFFSLFINSLQNI